MAKKMKMKSKGKKKMAPAQAMPDKGKMAMLKKRLEGKPV